MYRFSICDVFTDRRFGGNPLAVLTDARGLSAEQMQRIAREFGFSETTFVLPPEAGRVRQVRIFTPTDEIAFAGHPNLGTAWVLAHDGALGRLDRPTRVLFEERCGLVAVRVDVDGGRPTRCELTAPAPLELGERLAPERLAAAAGLCPADVATHVHPPRVASIGLPVIVVALRDRDALARARPNAAVLEEMAAKGLPSELYLYAPGDAGCDLRARMFAPRLGVAEDPATGSAGCALGALLGALDATPDGDLAWTIAQGVEMGRPSALFATVTKRAGEVVEARIAGDCVLVAEGRIDPS